MSYIAENFEFLILTVGSPTKSYHKKIIEKLLLNSKMNVSIVNLKEAHTPTDAGEKDIISILDLEMRSIEKHLKKDDFKVILDIYSENILINEKNPKESNKKISLEKAKKGFMPKGVTFLDLVKKAEIKNKNRLVFIVGSSFGLAKKVKKMSDFKLSLGKITLNHQIVPAVLLEYQCSCR